MTVAHEKEVARASRGVARTTSRGPAPWETNRAKLFAAHRSEKAVRPTGEPCAEPPSHQDSRVEGGTRVADRLYRKSLTSNNNVWTTGSEGRRPRLPLVPWPPSSRLASLRHRGRPMRAGEDTIPRTVPTAANWASSALSQCETKA
jgi:hypothetical protein